MLQLLIITVGIFCVTISSDAKQETTTVTSSDTTELSTTEANIINTTIGICESNDTNCSSVQKSDENSIEIPRNSKNETYRNKPHDLMPSFKTDAETKFCTCNLQINICDINCCCDPDCYPSDRAIFEYCSVDKNIFYDSRYCDYIKHIHINNTEVEWHVNQNGLFCVVSKNLPKSYFVQQEQPINTFTEAQTEISGKKFWPNGINWRIKNENFANLRLSKRYIFGDSLLIIKNDSSINYLALPRNFISGQCLFEEKIYFLNDEKYTCSHVVVDNENKWLYFSTYLNNFKIISSPKSINMSIKHIYKNCPKNVCLEVEPKLCNQDMDNCTKIEKNISTDAGCVYNFKDNLNTCRNIVKKVSYKLHHNGSEGLVKVEVLGALENVSYHFGGSEYKYLQEFEVEFLWSNKTKNYSEILSGNPGYINGKPILTGTQISTKNSTIIRRNSTVFLNNFLIVSENVGGKCVRNSTHNLPVKFNYNLITRCQIRKKLVFNIKENATKMCQEIQKAIFFAWGIEYGLNDTMVIGQFGNANPHDNRAWSKILYRTEPNIFLNWTRGEFRDKNTTLMCSNISTHLDIDLFHVRIDFQSLLNQQKLLGATFSFNDINALKCIMIKNKTVIVDLIVDVSNAVSFYDITKKGETKFVGPPSLDIRLPYDFFYPFIRVHNGIGVIKGNVFAAIIIINSMWLVY